MTTSMHQKPHAAPRPDVVSHPRRDTEARAASAPYIGIEGLWKSYDGQHDVLQDLNLSVHKGEFLTLLGPSGSGKTTTLMILAGFEDTSRGRILIDGRVIDGIPSYKRNIGVVFQNYALFPNMTVEENLAFPLRARRQRKDQISARIQKSLRMVRMEAFRSRYPAQLSGGQQQRVALARAMIFEPLLVLMDEPLGALDKQLRDQMQEELKELHRLTSSTIVYVTHDQGEALHMSDRIAVFNNGRIEQIGTPREIYETPATQFVAEFIGETNWLRGEVAEIRGDLIGVRVVQGETVLCKSAMHFPCGQSVMLAVRPEAILFEEPVDESSTQLRTTIRDVTYLGQNKKLKLALHDGTLLSGLAARNVELPPPGTPRETSVWICAKDVIAFSVS